MENRIFSVQLQKKTLKWNAASGKLLTQGIKKLNNAIYSNSPESVILPAPSTSSPNTLMISMILF
jgi:hypothetical protein